MVFLLGGVGHFIFAKEFAAIVPPLLLWPVLIVWFTGLLELLLVVGILWPAMRTMTGKLAAAYSAAVCVNRRYSGRLMIVLKL